MFVTVERRNSSRAVGILKDITPDSKLFIQGKYKFWMIHPDSITDFDARPDRMNGGDLDRTK